MPKRKRPTKTEEEPDAPRDSAYFNALEKRLERIENELEKFHSMLYIQSEPLAWKIEELQDEITACHGVVSSLDDYVAHVDGNAEDNRKAIEKLHEECTKAHEETCGWEPEIEAVETRLSDIESRISSGGSVHFSF